MKYSITISSLLLFMLVLAVPARAQKKLLKEVANEFAMANREITEENKENRRIIDLNKVKYDIDQVAAHPDTKDLAATYGWKGIVYTAIAIEQDETLRKQLDPNGEAATIAGDALVKFFSFPKDQQEDIDALTYVNGYLPNTIVALYNKAVVKVQTPGSFQTVKHDMEMVDQLLNYDKDEKAQGASVTHEKAIWAIATSAAVDTLVDQEIIYLEKLMAFPRYFNSEVFIRMSQIYVQKKEYEKALSYLEQGRIKIPQKANEFREAEINIEIERNNISSLITKLTESIKEDPENKEYYYARGVCYQQLKKNDMKEMSKSGKTTASYYFSQGLNDYAKAIALDPGYNDARVNEAILLKDSADYVYKMRSQGADYYNTAIATYKKVIEKMDAVREAGLINSGEEMKSWLIEMKKISVRIGDEEGKKRYEALLKAEMEKSKQ